MFALSSVCFYPVLKCAVRGLGSDGLRAFVANNGQWIDHCLFHAHPKSVPLLVHLCAKPIHRVIAPKWPAGFAATDETVGEGMWKKDTPEFIRAFEAEHGLAE